jgi:hypothetical protein
MRKTLNYKYFDIDLVNEWKQLTGDYNWIEFHPLMIRMEKENIHGMAEVELYLLGFGIRIYWTWNEKMLKKQLRKYEKQLKEDNWIEVKNE